MKLLTLTSLILSILFLSCNNSTKKKVEPTLVTDTTVNNNEEVFADTLTINDKGKKTSKEILDDATKPSIFLLYDLEIKKDNDFKEYGLVKAKNNSSTKTVSAVRFYIGSEECSFLIEKKVSIKPLNEQKIKFIVPGDCKDDLMRITVNEIVYTNGDFLNGMQIFLENPEHK